MSMGRPRFNMGRIQWIGAEAVGLPGQRTFRLLVQSEENAAQLWLEKEQLQALAAAVARMLAEVDNERGVDLLAGSTQTGAPKPANFPAEPELEMQVGALQLRYDPQRDVIALEASSRDADEGDPPSFRCLGTRKQMEELQAGIVEVISAGRPRCPLCDTPLPTAGLPHFCPPTNGHQKITIDTEEE